MPPRLTLSYLQIDPSLPVDVSKRIDAHVPNLRDYRRSRLAPEQALAAILGRTRPMSAILGAHPDFPGTVHPVHGIILESVLSRLTVGLGQTGATLAVDALDSSALVIGGPLASRHAAAIFGTKGQASLLGVDLPVGFDLSKTRAGAKAPERKAALVIKGRRTTKEHFVLTSLPMGDHRLVNISALTGIGGSAADLILGNPMLMEDLFVRTRPFSSGGWQAVFHIETSRGKPVAVDRDFRLFEIRGIDFDSEAYPLNDSMFLRQYAEADNGQSYRRAKIALQERFQYNSRVLDENELAAIVKSLKGYLKRNPGKATHARKKIETVLEAFGAAARSGGPDMEALLKRPKWSDVSARAGRNPAQFIKEVYGPELAKGALTRPLLRQVDFALYQNYANWIRPSRHPEDDLHLPTLKDTNTAELAKPETQELLRKYRRLATLSYRRRPRQRV